MKPLATIVFLLVSAIAAGQITTQYSEWAAGPARHLMTKDDLRAWKAVRSDAEAAAFIALFWARRDPTPATPRNEFREEFDRRVEVADQYFSSAKTRGAMSDRGKALILFGPPLQISAKGSTPSQSSLNGGRVIPTDSTGGVLLPTPRGQLAQQTWTYAHERKPRFIQQDRLTLDFVEEGVNEWQLATTERFNPIPVLNQAVNAFIISPNLMAPPVFERPQPSKEFKTADLRTAFQRFRQGGESLVGPAQLTWGEFLSVDGEPYVSAQLYAVAGSGLDAGQKVTFFSVVENAAGEIMQVDEKPATLSTSSADAYTDTSVRLAPGNYTATFGLAGADGTIVAAQRLPLPVTAIDPAVTGISQLILSNNIYPLQAESGPYDPFTFGALKVVPKGDLMFVPKGDLWYFAELRKPGLDEQGTPAVKVQVDITGKTAKGPAALHLPLAPVEVPLMKGTGDRYAVGQAIPLEGFFPGEYTIKVRVIDTIRQKTWDLEKTFFVRGL